MRHLSFKLPIVFRYTAMFVILFGLLHTTAKRRLTFKPYLLMSPLVAGYLCHEELIWWASRPKTPPAV